MSRPNLIAVFRQFPKELFRANYGLQIKLRAWAPHLPLYDIHAPDGMVEPKALNESTYIAPNGASMRPNSPYQQMLVSRLRGDGAVVYSVPRGTDIPGDLILVHERSDHYSFQPARTMSITDLNTKITRFMQDNAKMYTKAEWLAAYPNATEQSGLRYRSS